MRYAVKIGHEDWIDVPRDVWLALERQAGFIAQHRGEPATASWGATVPLQGSTFPSADNNYSVNLTEGTGSGASPAS